MMISRRAIVIGVPLFALAGCTGTNAQVTLDQAKAYANDTVNAVSAAAQSYVASPLAKNVAEVNKTVDFLQALNASIQAATVASTTKTLIEEVIAGINKLLPLVNPFLGVAGPYIPLALAVLEAFLNSLPPPADAPTVPPAALRAKGLQYRHPKGA